MREFMKKKLIMLLSLCLFAGIGLITAQTQTVTGVVISEEDGQPVVGASVVVTGTSLGTVTDANGKFSLFGVPDSAKTLRFSYIGMITQEVAIKTNLRIILHADTELLDEVVVTAMGISREKKALGYAVQDVKGEDLTR
ncbi:TonB-dependent receptor SusC, partial [termite gut metagenome]